MIFFGVAAVLILVLDIVTKWAVSHFMALHQSVEVFGDFGRLTYIRNPGAAFGLFSGSRISFIVISVVAIAIILSLLTREHYRGKAAMTALGMILGGAVGNLTDRVRVGEVVDFIDLGFGNKRWPVFNVADIGVTVGVCILAYALYRRGEQVKVDDQAGSDAPPSDGGGSMGPGEADEDDDRTVRPADSTGR